MRLGSRWLHLRQAAAAWREDLRHGRVVARAAIGVLARLRGARATPLPAVIAVRKLAAGEQALAARPDLAVGARRLLVDHGLATILRNADLGGWALDVHAINALGAAIADCRPRRALELGSGWSTVCLAHWLRQLHGRAGDWVVAIEQDPRHAARTTAQLRDTGLANCVRLIVAPLVASEHDGTTVLRYDLTPQQLRDAVGDPPPSLVLIDGPAAPPPARREALRQILPVLAAHSRLLLDDARRDGELAALSAWSTWPEVAIDGVVLHGKGVGLGWVRGGAV